MSETSSPKPASPGKNLLLKWLPLLLPVGWLWFHLISNLWLEWDTNPQYSYGMVVPILIVGLLFRRWMSNRKRVPLETAGNPWLAGLICVGLAFLLLPTRLIEEATPEWRPLQWVLAIETVGITLYAIYLAAGKGWLRQAAFPILFFLVAVPWPSPIETPLIQTLSRLNAQMVVEVLGIVGVPAIPHGNIIEVSTGVVGVDDACSGIRSLQSSLMISLFLGEFFMLSWTRRAVLVPLSFLLAMAMNLCRASILAWIAAKDGVKAIDKYHDQTGMSILLVCTVGLWLAGWLMSRKNPKAAAEDSSATTADSPVNFAKSNRFGYALIVWLAFIEIGVASWYHIRESHLKTSQHWTVKLPADNSTFQEMQPTEAEKVLLRFDSAKQGRWTETDGSTWQVYYFDWLPGRVAGYLAKRHTPDICLTATGLRMSAGPTLEIITVNGVDLAMRHYTFETANGPLQVYQCHWEAGLSKESYTADQSGRFNLIRGIWAGRGNQGQKVLELVIAGYPDSDEARKALGQQLEKIIALEK